MSINPTTRNNDFHSSYWSGFACREPKSLRILSIIGTIGSLLAIYFGINGLTAHDHPSSRNVSNLNQIESAILIASGTLTLVGLALFSVARQRISERVATSPHDIESTIPLELAEPTNEMTLEAFNQDLQLWILEAPSDLQGHYQAAAEKILNCFERQSDTLKLCNMKLSSLPKVMGSLNHLKTLVISYNQFPSFPLEICSLNNLETLVLEKNGIASLPQEIAFLINLKSLDLSRNQLSSLPPQIGSLVHLETLNLNENQLASLPQEIASLVNLKTLDLGKNQLTSLPIEIGSLSKLEKLILMSNQLANLPLEFFLLCNLQVLSLWRNPLISLPPQIGSLVNLRSLNLEKTQLSSLPPEIHLLIHLEELHLSENHLTSLPPEMGLLGNLKLLELSKNQFESLPSGLCSLSKLESLSFSYNNLTVLPPEIGLLSNLKWLHVMHNHLTTLPPEIGSLAKLDWLHLFHNDIASLPVEIAQLTSLNSLVLQSNPISSLPVELLFMQSSLRINIQNCGFSERSLAQLQQRLNAPGYSGPRIYFSISEDSTNENRTLDELLEELSTFAKWNKLSLKILVDDASNIESLHSWLARLSAIGDYKNKRENLATLVCQILEKAETDSEFRNIFWMCLTDAASTCGDRMALSLLYLGLHYQIAECAKEQHLAKLAYLLGHGLWALSQLEEVAKKKVESLACIDEIEVYLAFPIKLKEALKLPIVLETMLYFACSAVTEQDLAAAETHIKALLSNQDDYCRYLANNDIWQKALQASGIGEYTKLVDQRNVAIGKLEESANAAAYQQIDSDFKLGLIFLTKNVLFKEGLPPFLGENAQLQHG